MSEFWMIVFQNITCAIGDMIDTAFGNNINLDSICVLGVYTSFIWFFDAIFKMGSYAYRVIMKNEKICLLISLFNGVVSGIVIITLRNIIPHIYSLTDRQYSLFSSCLFVFGIFSPFIAIRDFMLGYLLIKCMNKLLLVANIIYYGLMIFLDALVLFGGFDLKYLVLATGISCLIYDIITISFSKIYKSTDKIAVKDLKLCLSHSLNLVITRLLSRIATLVYNIYASRLGTEFYAIHAVCYDLAGFTESITISQYYYQLVQLHSYNDIKAKWKKCLAAFKENCVKIVLLGYAFVFLLLPFVHGDTKINTLIVPLILYCSQVFFVQLYENMQGYLTSIERTDILKWTGVIGIVIRIPLAIFSCYTGIGIYGFALGVSIDFLIRGLYLYTRCKKYVREF